jgi:AraC-like DNA-binding protein
VPSDLFLVTVYCDPGFLCGERDEGADLGVVVSALRTRPAEFRSVGGGELAVALLTPLGLLQAFRTPMESLTDRRLPLAYFCSWAEQRDLRDALAHARAPQDRLHRLSAWLERRIADTREISGPPRRVAHAAMALYSSAGEPPSTDDLAAAVSLGRRQLEREFRRWLGVSPGHYSRLVRFQRASASVLAGRELMHVAAEHGYADQAHMTRAFREIALVTPGEVAAWGRRAGSLELRRVLAGRLIMVQQPGPEPGPRDAVEVGDGTLVAVD